MRWFWIDRFLEFERGRRAVTLKNVSVAEEHLEDPVSGVPKLHASLIVEGIAQTGGLLIGESHGFEKRVVLAKVSKAEFYELAIQGDQLRYTVNVDRSGAEGAMISGEVHLDGRLLAKIDLFFAYLDDRFPKQLFNPGDLLSWVVAAGMYEVGRDEHGQPLEIPEALTAGVELG
jgi:3-hydroxyacyl-[acyl-carrier-protein] dehydratase